MGFSGASSGQFVGLGNFSIIKGDIPKTVVITLIWTFGSVIPAMILGLVLGPMTERHFRRGMSMNQDSLVAFFSRPITMVIMLIFVAMYGFSFYQNIKAKRSKAR